MTSRISRLLAGLAALVLAVVCLGLFFQRPLGLALARRMAGRAFQRQASMAALPEGLYAGLCGSGSPLPDPTRAGPCVFVIAGKHLYIVDAGEGSPRKLALMGLAPARIEAILLTHFHSDHIAGLGEMMLQRWVGDGHQDPTPVFGPPGVERVVAGFNDAYALDKGYRVAHHGAHAVPPSGAGGVARPFAIDEGSDAGRVVLDRDGLTVTAFPVIHGPVRPAVGYRFDYRGRSLVVSGDTAPCPALEKHARGVDVLFHEGLQTEMVAILRDAAARHGQPGMAKILGDIPSYHTRPEDAGPDCARGRRQAPDLLPHHSGAAGEFSERRLPGRRAEDLHRSDHGGKRRDHGQYAGGQPDHSARRAAMKPGPGRRD